MSQSNLYGFLDEEIASGKGQLVPNVLSAVDRVMNEGALLK